MFHRFARGVSLAALLVASGSAIAAEPQDVANRLKTLLSGQGVTLSWQAIEGSGGSAVLKGASFSSPEASGVAQVVTLGDVSLSGIEDQADGAVKIGSMTAPDYVLDNEGTTVSIKDMEITGLILPGSTSTNALLSNGIFDTLTLGSVSATHGGKQVFGMQGFSYELDMTDSAKELTFSSSADSFSADLTTAGDPQALMMLTALGLTKPTGSFEAVGSLSTETGQAAFEQMDLTIDGAGTLGFTFTLGGYSEDVLKALQEMQRNASTATTEEQKQAQGMAALGLMQQLTFIGASIRYDDDSLAPRALDLAGGMQNMKRSDMVGMARMMIPAMAADYVSPEFAAKVADAVAKFVENPKSLEIVAAPAAPLPIAMLAAGAAAAPKALPEQLGVTISANEDAQ